MKKNVGNLVLEQLKAIRAQSGRVEDKIDALNTTVNGQSGILIALGGYMHGIDQRVEHIEQKLGIES